MSVTLLVNGCFYNITGQEAQLSQRDRAMFRFSEYFAKSLKFSENSTIQKLGYCFLFVFRSNTAKYVKRCTRTKFGERGFSFSGPAAWNRLPSDLQHCSVTDGFKKKNLRLFQLAFN